MKPTKAELARVQAYLGAKGGHTITAAKSAAARANGKKGGRPPGSSKLKFTPALAEAAAGLKRRKPARTWKFNPHIDGQEGGK